MQNILADITAQNWILALFIRDDGERFLLGTGAYEFKKSLQHFQPNTYANDVVELQGTDGQLLAGQVRRTASQPFDGYIADQTINQTETESRRRAFLMFFRKKHFYTVAYILPNGTAIQRRRGYITDAPAVAEMIQRWPEYHVALNFEDPNYYEYAEDEDGNPIYAHEVELAIAGASVGGLVWDEDGVVWDGGIDWRTLQTVQGPFINLDNAIDMRAPLSSVELLGNTTQNTLSGKNLLELPNAGTSSGITYSINSDGTFNLHGTNSANHEVLFICYIDSTKFQSTNYTLSANKALPAWSAVRLEIYNGTTWKRSFVSVDNTHRSQTATPDFTDANRVRVAVTVGSGKTVDIDNLGVMLEKSSSVTTFEPYCGGIASPNPDYPQTVQTTTGEQVVKMCGKNVYNATTAQATSQGLTYSGDTGYIYLNGTRTGNGGINWANGYLPAGKYKLMLELVSGSITSTASSPKGQLFYVYGKNITLSPSQIALSSNNPKGSITLTVSADTTNAHINSWARTTETCTNAVIKYQIVRGEVDDYDFEPYQSQSYEVNLGKNLFDGETVNGWLNSSGVLQSSTSDRTSTNYIAVQPNTTYTLHGTNSTYLKFTQFNGSKTAVSQQTTTSATTLTVTTGASTAYVRIGWGNASSASDVQLEIGQATDYAPYFTPIELCKLGDSQDKIYKSGDDWFVHKEVGKAKFADMNFNYGQIGSTGHYRQWSHAVENLIVRPPNNETLGNALSSAYTVKTATETYNRDTGVAVHNSGQIVVYDANYDEASSVAFNEKMAEIDAALYYALATPTDTQITNQALIDQLDALASSTLFVGVNNIALVPSGGAQGELKIIYPTDYALTGGAIWSIGGSGGQNIITVDGVDSAFPVWEVVGPATNPILTNTTTGQSITWNGTVPNGQSLVVDMGEQTATMAGANVFQYIDGQWIRLDAGNNTLTYTATGATAPSILSWNGVVG